MGTYVGDDKTNEIQWQGKSGRPGLMFIGTDVAVEHVAHHAWVCHFGFIGQAWRWSKVQGWSEMFALCQDSSRL